jgi:hypothetical protein
MSGVSQPQPILALQQAVSESSLRPFYDFLVKHDLRDVPVDNEQIARKLADQLRRAMYRLLADYENAEAGDNSLRRRNYHPHPQKPAYSDARR